MSLRGNDLDPVHSWDLVCRHPGQAKTVFCNMTMSKTLAMQDADGVYRHLTNSETPNGRLFFSEKKPSMKILESYCTHLQNSSLVKKATLFWKAMRCDEAMS